jgi:hypothetical protein
MGGRWISGLVVAACLVGAAQAGKVYRWVDEAGKVHFGDRPLANDAEQVELRRQSAPAAPADSAHRKEKTRRLLRAWEEERRIEAEQKQAAKQKAQEREQRCHRARHELRDLEAGGLFYELDEQGERRYWSEAEVRAEQERWREEIARWCQ